MVDKMYVRISAPEGGILSDVARPFFIDMIKRGYLKEGRDEKYGGMLFRHRDTGKEITVVMSNHPLDIEDRRDEEFDDGCYKALDEAKRSLTISEAEKTAEDLMRQDDDLHDEEGEDDV